MADGDFRCPRHPDRVCPRQCQEDLSETACLYNDDEEAKQSEPAADPFAQAAEWFAAGPAVIGINEARP